MKITLEGNENHFRFKLNEYLSVTIINHALAFFANFLLAMITLGNGLLSMGVVMTYLSLLSLYMLFCQKRFKHQISRYKNISTNNVHLIKDWKYFYDKTYTNSALMFLLIVPIFVVVNLISGMNFTDMLTDTYSIICIPLFTILSICNYLGYFKRLPGILQID